MEKVFRAILQHAPDALFDWDLLLPAVINAINARTDSLPVGEHRGVCWIQRLSLWRPSMTVLLVVL